MSGSDCTDLSHCECVDSLYERIDNLEQRVIDSRTRTNDLERWVAGIADDQKMPTYVQQSARSLLVQEGKSSEYSKVLYRISLTDRGDYILESVDPTNFGGTLLTMYFEDG